MDEPDGSEAAIHLLDRAIAQLGQPDSQLSMRLDAHLLAAAGLKLSTRPIHIERIDRLYPTPLGDDPAARLVLANLAFWTLIDGRTPDDLDDLAAHADGARSPADAVRRVAQRAIGDGRLVREEGADSELLYFPIAALLLADFLDPAAHWLDAVIEDARKSGSLAADRRGVLPAGGGRLQARGPLGGRSTCPSGRRHITRGRGRGPRQHPDRTRTPRRGPATTRAVPDPARGRSPPAAANPTRARTPANRSRTPTRGSNRTVRLRQMAAGVACQQPRPHSLAIHLGANAHSPQPTRPSPRTGSPRSHARARARSAPRARDRPGRHTA